MSFKTELITKRDMSKDFCWILKEDLEKYKNSVVVVEKHPQLLLAL